MLISSVSGSKTSPNFDLRLSNTSTISRFLKMPVMNPPTVPTIAPTAVPTALPMPGITVPAANPAIAPIAAPDRASCATPATSSLALCPVFIRPSLANLSNAVRVALLASSYFLALSCSFLYGSSTPNMFCCLYSSSSSLIIVYSCATSSTLCFHASALSLRRFCVSAMAVPWSIMNEANCAAELIAPAMACSFTACCPDRAKSAPAKSPFSHAWSSAFISSSCWLRRRAMSWNPCTLPSSEPSADAYGFSEEEKAPPRDAMPSMMAFFLASSLYFSRSILALSMATPRRAYWNSSSRNCLSSSSLMSFCALIASIVFLSVSRCDSLSAISLRSVPAYSPAISIACSRASPSSLIRRMVSFS